MRSNPNHVATSDGPAKGVTGITRPKPPKSLALGPLKGPSEPSTGTGFEPPKRGSGGPARLGRPVFACDCSLRPYSGRPPRRWQRLAASSGFMEI